MLLPGLLGSLFVFAGIWAAKLGAAATISIWSPASCAWGCWWTSTAPARRRCANLPALFGALLLVAGAYLVAKRSF